MSEERVVKSVMGEIVLDLRPRDIEKVFHLPRTNKYVKITYDQVERSYRDNGKKAKKTIQSSFFIDRTLVGHRVGKVDMTRGYKKDDIRYLIILLRIIMGLLVVGHLHIWMVHFIETIRTTKMPIDWATMLSENLDEQFIGVRDDPKFYMTSYLVYLLVARTSNYPRLYKKGSMQDANT